MASGGPAVQQQANELISKVRTLINNDLKEICKAERLHVSGVKAALQARIITHINTCVQSGDIQGLNRMRRVAFGLVGSSPPVIPQSAGRPLHQTSSSPPHPSPYTMPNGFPRHPSATASRTPTFHPRVHFKESPFYVYKETLMSTIELNASPNLRSTEKGTLTLSHELCENLKSNPSFRILLFSASDPLMGHYSRADVTFPHQLEVRVNGDEVKSNFKGLKNKPGSTRPADITHFVRKLGGYQNTISVTYALTQKKYYFVVNLVRKFSVEELTDQIKRGRIISKQSVINEMIKKADDPDIVATSTVLSLKDPVSTLRIQVPCRSTICSHNQCFDVTSFLQLQEQAPTWICPICNKTLSFEGLVVDQYVQEILQSTPRSIDQVTIEPDGKWSQNSTANTSRNSNGKKMPYDDDDDDDDEEEEDDDDLIDVTDHRLSNIKTEASNTSFLARTPPHSSREASTAGSAAPRSANKRTSEVIDLTLSDDDDAPPTKRMSYSTPNSLPDPPRSTNRLSNMSNSTHSRPVNGIVHPFRLPPAPVTSSPLHLPPLPHRPPGNGSYLGYGSYGGSS